MLAEDWPGSELFLTSTGARVEVLSGWSRDTIAQEATSIGCDGSIEDFQLLHDLTGALPLFVRDARRICKEAYRGNISVYVADLSSHVSIHTTSQEVIVSQVLERLTEDTRAFTALLGIFTVPFHRDVVLQVTAPALRLTRTQAARQFRVLHSSGSIGLSRWRCDFARQLPLAGRSASVGPSRNGCRQRAGRALSDCVGSIRKEEAPTVSECIGRRLMFETRRIEGLVDLLTNTAEVVLEFGLERRNGPPATKVADYTSLVPEDRFWAGTPSRTWPLIARISKRHVPLIEKVQAPCCRSSRPRQPSASPHFQKSYSSQDWN